MVLIRIMMMKMKMTLIHINDINHSPNNPINKNDGGTPNNLETKYIQRLKRFIENIVIVQYSVQLNPLYYCN